MKIYLVLLKFFFIGALFIVSNHQLYLSDSSDLMTFKEMYIGWLESVFNQASHVTSYVIHSNWLPGE